MIDDNPAPPMKIIMDTTPYSQLFWQHAVLPLIPFITDRNRESVLRHIYQECFREIFDVITPDFNDFVADLADLPEFERLTLEPFFRHDVALRDRFKACVVELGVGLYFCLRENGYFSSTEYYLLDHVTFDYLVLHHAS